MIFLRPKSKSGDSSRRVEGATGARRGYKLRRLRRGADFPTFAA